MDSAQEQFDALMISHAIGLNRLSRSQVLRLLRILERSDRAAVRELRRRLGLVAAGGYDRGPYTTLRLRRILGDIRNTLADAYRRIGGALQTELFDLAEYESDYMQRALQSTIPDDIFAARPVLGIGRPGADLLKELTRGAVVMDQPLGQYFRKQGASSLVAKQMTRWRKEIRQAIEVGLVSGDSVETMVRRITRQVSEFAIPAGRRHLRTLVDSSVKATMQRSRTAFLEANAGPDGLVKAIVWDSTFDSRTTLEWCVPRHGKRYDAITKAPIGHGLAWGGGPGVIHPRCRSGQTTILRTWRELGIPGRELSKGTRASMIGPVSADLGMEDFYRQLSEPALAKQWGDGRAALFKRGGLSLSDMVKKDGVLYTLAELRKVESEAFDLI